MLQIVALPGGQPLAAALARELPGLARDAGALFVHRFPDGEALVRIDAPMQGERVLFAGSLDHPDAKALPLLFAADAARELGAREVGLVTPYLAYMRQDHRFSAGEAISSRSFARLLSSCLDHLVTVDPHLHRWNSLSDIYTIPTRIVPSAPAIAQWIRSEITAPLIVGPDSESEQWVAEVARLAGAPWTVMDKTRRGDRDVSVAPRDAGPWPGRTPVIVDDIISTGRTLMACAQALSGLGLDAPECICVHALFADDALADLRRAGFARIVSCDTVAHPSNGISMAASLAVAVREFLDVHP